ncbi:MAG TPA: bifunctional demethylmenaquinone methyltransferase/2-methoxy-6-polyprenyl-1,4-benzoquinol methylase UbiE [Deltaproteobacteria bacterium]|nr:bifunctional demethylmenaquinone methyltransferase/2-methoxy-6-polyprenyl-1,4-benzoquinol methylase UbiE [Deltaproteobacteria bacterium]HCP46345.1 bifunctional demethylmenaquinone methyltransferase/2-methoxy-6-polyprenyl-1,4-benzoquinol methylase UbiE [Deltaproteobacteria bacterium]
MDQPIHQDGASTQAQGAPGSGEMFDTIAERYDLLNRVLSLGLDGSWRRRAVRALQLSEATDTHVLDLAAGTGDLSFAIAAAHPKASVVGVDPSTAMLQIAQEKAQRIAVQERVTFQVGDAQQLELEEDSFDACSIAFGIRNVPRRDLALREMARVVRPGGRIVILELSIPRSGLMAWGARLQVDYVVPLVGGFLSGPQAYRHLRDSMHAFPSNDQFALDMGEAGLEVSSVDVLAPGVCTVFAAQVPAATGSA